MTLNPTSSATVQISEITFRNFRCFGDIPTRITLSPLTAYIGTNGAGKTAVLQGLVRLFGISNSDRTVEASDFHLLPGVSRDSLKADIALSLSIDATIVFPELASDDFQTSGVAACFKRMSVQLPDRKLFCRIRLEATWRKGNVPDGEIEQRLYWIRSTAETPTDADKIPVASHERSQIHVHYIPAARDPVKQIRYVSGTILKRLLGAIRWSDAIHTEIDKTHKSLNDAFSAEAGVKSVSSQVNVFWQRLHSSRAFSTVKISPSGRLLQDLLQTLRVDFTPGEDGHTQELDRLSDGLKSLFYLSMVAAGFEIECQVVKSNSLLAQNFVIEELDPPALTLFAMEEPENHIAPHYLGRIVALLRNILETNRAQALLTSHSPAILQRIEPLEVRHLRIDPVSQRSIALPIRLPEIQSDAFKFVREAVQAFPELYFSRVVVLAEGDSEQIVIPKLASALEISIDTSFVSIVPLGGRHVNHFWRLLSDLSIPHVTLLDLDRERKGGGWSRIKYALIQLLENGHSRESVLSLQNEDQTKTTLSDDELNSLGERDVADTAQMQDFINHLETFGVFFSAPLDFDFLLLRAMPQIYQQIPDGADGPRLPTGMTAEKSKAAYDAAIRAVLKPEGGKASTYTPDEQLEFFWYRYLFLGRGKPATHMRAMSETDRETLNSQAPPVLRRLCSKLETLLLDDAEQETLEATREPA
jgi:putative ATP-dependent endonuclease of OLD family